MQLPLRAFFFLSACNHFHIKKEGKIGQPGLDSSRFTPCSLFGLVVTEKLKAKKANSVEPKQLAKEPGKQRKAERTGPSPTPFFPWLNTGANTLYWRDQPEAAVSFTNHSQLPAKQRGSLGKPQGLSEAHPASMIDEDPCEG